MSGSPERENFGRAESTEREGFSRARSVEREGFSGLEREGFSRAAYHDTRALVIGGLGFLGVNLSRRLSELGARVTIVTPSIARHAEAAADAIDRDMRIVEADIRDERATASAVEGHHVIFDLAGRSGAVQSMEDPATDLDVNCRGSLVLLEALRARNPRAKLVFVSSRLAYGRTGSDPVDEDRRPAPTCVHAIHKVAVEQYLQLYGRVHGVRSAVARLTNPYGPGQPRERIAYGIVNRLIHLALADETLLLFGDGRQLRDYLYVDDAVDALLALGASQASDGRIYNVGSGAGTPIVEMARAIAEIAGGGRIGFVPWPDLAERVETGDFVADVSRIRRDLGWSPRVALRDGLERTVAFYRAHVA
jgi:UDP-glucose 4-epimerase